MRRMDREIRERVEIIEIMKKCDVCRVAFWDEEFPYIVPMNFGFDVEGEQIALYFHGVHAGTKLRLLEQNPNVAFEMDCSHQLLLGDLACDATMAYESVCGNGYIEVVTAYEEKLKGLSVLMNQYVPDTMHQFSTKSVEAIMVLKIRVNQISGKRLVPKV